MINEHGGIARTAQLRSDGATPALLRNAVAAGALRRVRRGWYATARVPPEVVAAVRCGGRVSCLTALTMQGVWMIKDVRVHVCVSEHGQRRRQQNVVLHWRNPVRGLRYPMDGICAALEQLARCRPVIEVIIAADSILNRGLADYADVISSLSATEVGRQAMVLIDGASDSGIETLVRVPLVRRGIQLQTQAFIPGVGFVDILVGDRLVLELDGEEWHTEGNFETDRERDAKLVVAGYIVIRASYRQVMDHWPELERRILTLIRRRDHLWRAGDEKLGHRPRSYRRAKPSVG